MIPLSEINNYANIHRVPAETIEKDYVICWILACLSKSLLKDKFIFYGGTAIKRIYFEKHRFSEDIDLISSNKYSLDDIINELNCFTYALEQANVRLQLNESNIINSSNRVQLFIQYIGYEQIIGAPKEIRIDFAMGMPIYGDIIKKEVIPTYTDLRNKQLDVSVLSMNTILANKLGMLMDLTRNEPRDLFDVWFILQRLDQFKFDIEKVRNTFKDKFSFNPSISVLQSHIHNKSLKNRWVTRLNKQIADLPDADLVAAETLDILKQLLGS